MSGSLYGYHAFMHQNQRTRVTRAAELAIQMLNNLHLDGPFRISFISSASSDTVALRLFAI